MGISELVRVAVARRDELRNEIERLDGLIAMARDFIREAEEERMGNGPGSVSGADIIPFHRPAGWRPDR